MDSFKYNDYLYPVEIIKKSNRNTYIRVKKKKIIVTTNYLVSLNKIEQLIKDNEDAIIKMIKQDEVKNKDDDINIFSFFGIEYHVLYGYQDTKIEEDLIYAKDEKTLQKYFSLKISEVFENHLNYWYNKFEEKIPQPNLKIRKMTSRWGVCNLKNNNVTLNYELHKYNTKYLDYVIVHELSHFIYPNHSKNFWNQVGKYYPDYKVIRKYLRLREKN